MIAELDTVVLCTDRADYGLEKGDLGAVVHAYQGGYAFEVEFVTAYGATVAVITLTASDVRLMDENEILHVRTLGRVDISTWQG